MSQTPASIGKYDVEGVIGEGAMGVVYRATDRVLNRRVAIKVMNDAIAKDTALRERFLREAQAAGSLQHPNVVTIYDFGEVDDHLYIAMEYVEGDDLEDLLVRKVRLPLDGKLGLVIDVLQGLAFAHKRGIVHRDIKPANIRIDSDGRARLMDFGIAHLDSSKMTRTGTMLGTPSYMAPEQIAGGIVAPSADIFSVGAVLYELLTGTRPFNGDSLQALMYQVLSVNPRSLQTLDPELPQGLNAIVMRALQKAPGDRYHNALDMASDLATVRTTLGPAGGRSSLSLRATIDSALALRTSGIRARARRRRSYFAGGALATLALVVLALQLPRQASGGAESASLREGQSDSPIQASDTASALPTAPESSAPDERALAVAPPPTAVTESVERPAPRAPQPDTAGIRRRETAAVTARAQATTARSALAEARKRAESVEAAAATPPPAPVTAAVQPGSSPPPELTAQQPVVQLQLAAPQGPAVPAATPPAAPPLPPVDHPAAIAAVIANYARALESRDIARLQRAYPGITSTQRRAFEDFFRETRSLDVSLDVSSLQVDGATAQAQLAGTYEFVTSSGSSERRPASFQAVLRQDQGAWRLVSVR